MRYLRTALLDSITPMSSFQEVHKRFRSVDLKLQTEGIDVDASFGELLQYLLAVATVRRHHGSHFAVIGKRFQRALGHSVHRVWRSQGLNVENVGGLRVLGSRARK